MILPASRVPVLRCLVALVLAATAAIVRMPRSYAESTTTSHASTDARREDLARVQELLADPDPLARLSNLEAIIEAGDSLKLQVALRTALSSDDVELRALAMRAYLATRRNIVFDIVLPTDAQKLYDNALVEPEKLSQLVSKYPWARVMSANAGKLLIDVADFKIREDTGTIAHSRSTFTISGDRFSTNLMVTIGGGAGYACFLDFRPTSRLTFEGTLSCAASMPKLGVTAAAF